MALGPSLVLDPNADCAVRFVATLLRRALPLIALALLSCRKPPAPTKTQWLRRFSQLTSEATFN